MRTEAAGDEGVRLQGLFREAIRQAGQPLRVTPSPGRAGAGDGVRTLYATIETPNANDVGHLRIEGDLNAAAPAPVVFTFSGGSGVHENDRLEWQGFTYILLNALPQTYRGVVMGIRCVGIRRGAI